VYFNLNLNLQWHFPFRIELILARPILRAARCNAMKPVPMPAQSSAT
jgi:hypothetical protein